jgi:Type ISP C-terminal specificity domain/N-6 DNA Methylase
MSNKKLFDRYLLALRKIPIDEKTEHTDRAALQSLLQEIADVGTAGTIVQHEPKRVADKGAPDFKVKKGGLILGYVENKGIGENLDKALKSDQMVRYSSLSHNIILTDYLHFIWINKDGIQRETLCHAADLQNSKFRLRDDRIIAVTHLLEGFFSAPPEGIGRAQQLALALATRSRFLRDYLSDELVRQEREHKQGRLYGLFQIFRDQIFHELTLSEFADAFAQMLAYGLFLSRLNSGADLVTLHNAREFVPGSFRLIRELVDFLAELEKPEYSNVRWVVEEVLSIVNGLDLSAIREDLSFRQRKAINRNIRASDEEEHRLFERDPFIYFYEDYLKAYDPIMRKSRGVYYTPPPIVNFIVRAVDDLLKDKFEISSGVADHRGVTVLDFACGTGTFLLEVFQRAFENLGGSENARADLIVREHFLKNIYGFEYLIAPYTIAHLKLSQYLKDRGHALKDGERLQVLLTNTLEPVEPQPNFLVPAVSAEVEAAQTVKEKPILVITGNPPYSGRSKNKGPWITTAIDEYMHTRERTIEGLEIRKPLGERNPKWLYDDYVKFLRFAQLKMDGFTFKTAAPDGKVIEHSVPGTENGIVGVITNHRWLDNPTFRGMRQSLMRSFNQIYVLDLHGYVKERTPDGSADENVFDIKQGVAISLFVKRPSLERGVWRGDLWGKRLEKYQAAADGTLKNIDWVKLEPSAPFNLFARQDIVIREEYDEGWRLPDVFPTNVLGFQTHRDDFAVSFSKAEMQQKLKAFADPKVPDDELARLYGLKSNRDWSFSDARAAARAGAATTPILVAYKPFDERWSEFSTLTMDYPRRELRQHVAGRHNLCLLAPRQIDVPIWRHAFVTALPAESCCISSETKSQNYVFPAWTFGSENKPQENLSISFREFIDARYEHHYSIEEVFGYIYAVLHAATYRKRYAEFLRVDFPRVPFPKAADDFELISGLGWALMQSHLLNEPQQRGLAQYHGKGNHVVETVRYSPADEAVAINKTQFFKSVSPVIWDFHIGGYQVLDKYLKSRRRRPLSLGEIERISAIAGSIAFTVEQMAKIDKAYTSAFA